MNRMIKPLLFTLFVFGIFSSCTKKTSSPAPSTPVSGISASLSGTTWTATSTTPAKSSQQINIRGSKADGTYMQVTFPPNASTGSTYTLPSSGIQNFEYFDTNVAYLATLGTITITSYNTSTNVLTGTFSGTLTDPSNGSNTIKVTNGTFTAVF